MGPEGRSSPKSEAVSAQTETPTSPPPPSYLARDEARGRRVALEVVRETREGDEQSRSRFRREARARASVEHPNVVRLRAFGAAGSSDCLALESVEGETLARGLSRAGALTEVDAQRIPREVLLGLVATPLVARAAKGVYTAELSGLKPEQGYEFRAIVNHPLPTLYGEDQLVTAARP